MPVINLIEPEIQLRQRLQRRVRLLGLVGFALLTLAAVGWGGLILYAGYLQMQKASMEAEIVRLTPALHAVQQTQMELNALQPLISTLQTARTQTGRWRLLLQHLSVQTPPACYLTSVELGKRTDPKKPIEIVIKGIAASQQAVGDFMLRLNQYSELENVRLDYTQERELSEQGRAFEFQITAQVKGTAAPQSSSGGGSSGS